MHLACTVTRSAGHGGGLMNRATLYVFVAVTLVGSTFGIDSAFAEDPPEIRVSHGANGQDYVFTRDRRFPALGEAWRDPDGMTWGDLAKDSNGTILHMSEPAAAEHCKSIGADLPTRTDFIRLRGYMGASP